MTAGGKLLQNTGDVDGTYRNGHIVVTLHVAPILGQ
jgi:hypothetical protein